MSHHPPRLDRPAGEAGFMLLETIVGIAISASLVLLLIATLNGLGRSQERINIAVESINADVFDDVFVRTLFAGIRPGYHDAEAHFEGSRYRVSARTYVDHWSPPGGERFTLELEPGSDGAATLSLRDRSQPLPGLGRGDFQLEYVDHFGRVSDVWQVEQRGGVDLQVQRLAPFTTPVPRQVRIVRRAGSETQIMLALDLAAFDWPAPRPQDDASITGAF